ncbi:MAG: VanZ family protein [Thermodesulfovibrionales bacterium]|nr:VanZ family protein [Thermodesulfovibrionales bacterium]
MAYCIFIFALSSSSKPLLPTPSFYGADKVIHGIEYTVLGLLLSRSIFNSNLRFSGKFLIILTVALAILYGISDEIHQAFIPGRDTSPWDVLADGLGGTLGVLCYTKANRARQLE